MIDHERCQQLMKDYLAGRLTPAQVDDVEFHLLYCEECDEALRALESQAVGEFITAHQDVVNAALREVSESAFAFVVRTALRRAKDSTGSIRAALAGLLDELSLIGATQEFAMPNQAARRGGESPQPSQEGPGMEQALEGLETGRELRIVLPDGSDFKLRRAGKDRLQFGVLYLADGRIATRLEVRRLTGADKSELVGEYEAGPDDRIEIPLSTLLDNVILSWK